MSVSAQAPPSPFKGLAAFEDTDLDALFFCGREREREVVVANLLASRLTVLYGPSGVGKTSLLRAAVAHSLRASHDAAVVVFSSWAGDPREGLGTAIDEAVGIEADGTLTERLHAASRAVRGHVYVILDQFEEYFLYHDRGPFADELADAIADPGLRASFLLGLREDALAKLDSFKGQVPNLFANYLRLDHLDRAGARAAILGPVDRYNELTGENVRVEPELVEAVLDEVAAGRVDVGQAGRGGVEADAERIEAPYLQLVLERLWEAERERGSNVLHLATLQELGGAEPIVRAHLERALGRLNPAEQDVAATMFAQLVTPSGSKIAHRPGDLAQYAAVPEAQLRPVLDVLGQERIVRAVDGAGGGERYEIFHDVLADGVLAWRARRELERDRERAHERQRRLAIFAAAALVALAVMTAVAVYAFVERSHASSSARQARARALEATALAELPVDPQRALSAAVRATRLSPSSRAAEVLRQALLQAHLRRVLAAPGPVTAVSFAGHGGGLLAASDRGTRIYSADGTVTRTLPGRASFSPSGKPVAGAAAISKDGRLILVTSAHGATVRRAETGRTVATLDAWPVQAGTFSPDGRLVAAIRPGGRTAIFDARSGRLIHVLPRKGVKAAQFSPDGALLATADYHGVELWSPRSGRRVAVLDDGAPTKLMNDCEFSSDGKLLAAAGQDGALRVWDVARRVRRFYFPAHTNPLFAVAWSPDGRFVADASGDRSSFVWEVRGIEHGERVATLAGHQSAVTSVAFSADGGSILTGSADGTARLWDTRFEQDLQPLGAHRGGAVTASFGAGGRLVVSAGADGARIWNVRTRRLLHKLLGIGRLNDAELSRDGRRVVTAGADSRVQIFDARTGAHRASLRAGAPVLVARFSPDGRMVVLGDAKGHLSLWRGGKSRPVLRRQNGPVDDADFAPDGKSVATAGFDGVSIWSVPDGRRLRLLRTPDDISRVSWSPDGSLVAAAAHDGTARIWDASNGKRLEVLKASKLPLTDAVFSPDGRRLLTTGVGLGGNVETWDVQTGERLHVLVGHFGSVSGGAFSPDGRWIVTAGPISAGLWQAGADRPYAYLRGGDTKLQGLTAVSFSPDGRLILSASKDGSVRLYRCEVCGNLEALTALADARLAASR